MNLASLFTKFRNRRKRRTLKAGIYAVSGYYNREEADLICSLLKKVKNKELQIGLPVILAAGSIRATGAVKLITNEISDFCAGLGQPGEPETPEEIQQSLLSRILPLLVGQPSGLTPAAQDVLAERQRQVTHEGWTPEHDDQYRNGELARAAACYATMAVREEFISDGEYAEQQKKLPFYWPWPPMWWKPVSQRRDLVRAGALILAEIDRIDRCKKIVEPGDSDD